jgi:hypothetical protein
MVSTLSGVSTKIDGTRSPMLAGRNKAVGYRIEEQRTLARMDAAITV